MSHVGLCSALCAVHISAGSCVGQRHTRRHHQLLPTSAVWAKDRGCIMHGDVSRRGGNSREKERGGIEVEMGRCSPSAPWIWYLSVLSGGPLLPRTPYPTWCSSVAPALPCQLLLPPFLLVAPPGLSLPMSTFLQCVTPPKAPNATSSQEAPSSASSQDGILTHPAEPNAGEKPRSFISSCSFKIFLVRSSISMDAGDDKYLH